MGQIMDREPNTDAEGRPFTAELIEAVWQKARSLGAHTTLRVDAWGWTIVRQDYGNTRSRYGWEIDHIVPPGQGGTDDLSNLQPLQWENNRRKDEVQPMISSKRPTERPTKASGHASHPRRKGH